MTINQIIEAYANEREDREIATEIAALADAPAYWGRS